MKFIRIHCLCPKQKMQQIIQFVQTYINCSNLHQLTVQYQNKLALNPFDDKRMYSNPIQSLPWDKHTQQGHCLVYIV